MNFSHEKYPGGPGETDTLSCVAEPEVEPLYSDYRDLAIETGFDWPQIVADLSDRRGLDDSPLYLVVFRSTRRPDIEEDWVANLDKAAHDEAGESDALLYYFAGKMDDESRKSMSWCLWTGSDAARNALSGPAHQEAVRQAPGIYDTFRVEFYNVNLSDEGIIFDPVLRH